MNRPLTHPAASPFPPWPATASVLLAFAALALNEDAVARGAGNSGMASVVAVLPIFLSTVAVLVSFISQQRLEQSRPAVWILRSFVIGGAVLYATATTKDIKAFFYMNYVARAAGLCFVGEAAVQHWQRPPPGQSRSGVLVFLAAIIFVLASRTVIRSYVRFLTPPFMVLLVLSMRSARLRVERGREVQPWLAALALAALLGGTTALVVAEHSTELNRILLSILKPTNYNDVSDVNARPVLRGSFNQPLSPQRIFRVEGPMLERHMRGLAFETYASAGGWGSTVEARAHEESSPTLKARPGGQRLIVKPLIESLNVLYVPLHMAGVEAKSYRLMWARNWGGAIYASTNLDAYPPYEISIVTDTYDGPLCGPISDKLRERCLDIPDEFDPRVRKLAESIAAGTGNTRDKLDAIRKYFNRNHAYSLEIDPGTGDPVANFLLQKKDGHCQYFASSSVLLLRCMGVPARYVTGYYAHESPEPDVTVVRQRDAHAWAEVWVEGDGWETFDATPSSGMPSQTGSISFWSRLWERIGDWAEEVGAWMRVAPFTKLGLAAGSLVALFFIIRWVYEWRDATRQTGLRITYASAGRPFETLAAAFNDWLKHKGAPCPPQRPWRDHLALLKDAQMRGEKNAATSFDLDSADAFVREYSSARFGGQSNGEVIAQLTEQFKKLA